MTNEVWKEIVGFSKYEISSFGRIKRKQRIVKNNRYPNFTCILKEKILKMTFHDGSGWTTALIDDYDAQQTNLIVARLALTTFIRPPQEGEVARHLDDNKFNQNIKNLAWGTVKQNGADAVRNGRYKVGSLHGRAKLTEDQVREIRKSYIFGDKNYGLNALARKYNMDPTSISDIIRGNHWKGVY